MVVNNAAIQRLLLQNNAVTKEQIESAILLAPSLGKSFVDTLIYKNYISQDNLGKLIADAMGVGYVSLRGRNIQGDTLKLIPEDSAYASQVIPFERANGELHIAMADPTNFELINFLERKTGLVVKPYFTFPDQITAGLSLYKSDINEAIQRLTSNVNSLGKDLTKAAEEVPIIKMMETIMDYAIAQHATDIHMEAQEQNSLIRFRIDGMLHDILVLDRAVQAALVARIKFLSNLKIDEHRLPQDGRFKYEHGGNRVAIRLSVIPTFYGENAALRILPETSRAQTLDELGFTAGNIKILTTEVHRTNGMVLLTGPTGSGKTTTLYSMLDVVNKPEVKISTIEDPIEYSMPRVAQTQVNTQTGMDFASGLRALLRHDPDIIMVGEIRDSETADIAVNAALTGHIVLSTLHTNDSTSSIPRLIDLGVEPFLISATLRAVVAQRLVRRLCPKCAEPITLSDEQIHELVRLTRFSADDLRNKDFKASHGCPDCSDGYKGRFGIHEVFRMTEEMADLVLKRVSNDELRNLAVKQGMYTMFQDGIAKAAVGLTTIEEVFRRIETE